MLPQIARGMFRAAFETVLESANASWQASQINLTLFRHVHACISTNECCHVSQKSNTV